MIRRFASFAFVIVIGGCVTPGRSSFNYIPPNGTRQIINETIIAQPFDTVWDRLVERLATGFFVINNIDKSSRLINVSFSSDTPQQYVDCGESTRHYSFKKDNQIYTYDVAADSSYKATGKWGPYNNLPTVANISRDASLDGRINIYVAPTSTTKTKVSVNVKYILHVSITGNGTAYNAFGGVEQQFNLRSSSVEASLTTTEPVSKNWDPGTTFDMVTCRATGKLEKILIEKAQP